MESQFKGKVAVVTGGGSGIGRSSALAFAREGASVVVADLTGASSKETVRMVKAAGGDAVFIQTDVSKAAEVEAMIRQTVETFGRLDFAHNNAGVEGILASTVSCTEEEWDRVLNINLKGVWLCLKHEIPQMLQQGGGSIVNTASVAGLVGFKGFPAYVASKHGIVGLTKAAALDYARSGIRINAVCPGLIRTPMIQRQTEGDPDAEAVLVTGQPCKRMGGAEEVAEAVIWLCSEAASFVMGHAMVVDGGYTAR